MTDTNTSTSTLSGTPGTEDVSSSHSDSAATASQPPSTPLSSAAGAADPRLQRKGPNLNRARRAPDKRVQQQVLPVSLPTPEPDSLLPLPLDTTSSTSTDQPSRKRKLQADGTYADESASEQSEDEHEQSDADGSAEEDDTNDKDEQKDDTSVTTPARRTLKDIIKDHRSGQMSSSAIEKQKKRKLELEAKKKAATAAAGGHGSAEHIDNINKSQHESKQTEGDEVDKEDGEENEDDEDIDLDAEGSDAEADLQLAAPQVKFVNGQIVLNEESLMIQQPEIPTMEYTGGYDANHTVTSASYTNRNITDKWSVEETKLFYKSLATYGTDFTFIAQMFPKRTRKMVKNKFKREERLFPHLIDKALNKRLPIDVADFERRVRECAEYKATSGSTGTGTPAAGEKSGSGSGNNKSNMNSDSMSMSMGMEIMGTNSSTAEEEHEHEMDS